MPKESVPRKAHQSHRLVDLETIRHAKWVPFRPNFHAHSASHRLRFSRVGSPAVSHETRHEEKVKPKPGGAIESIFPFRKNELGLRTLPFSISPRHSSRRGETTPDRPVTNTSTRSRQLNARFSRISDKLNHMAVNLEPLNTMDSTFAGIPGRLLDKPSVANFGDKIQTLKPGRSLNALHDSSFHFDHLYQEQDRSPIRQELQLPEFTDTALSTRQKSGRPIASFPEDRSKAFLFHLSPQEARSVSRAVQSCLLD